MSDWTGAGVSEIAAAVKSKKVSAAEVMEAHLSRIAAKNENIHAFLGRDDDKARAQAKATDEQVARGEAKRG